jgi:hypothetical protein
MTAATCSERRRIIEMKFLKTVMILAIAAGALSLGACAQKKETMTTSSGTTTSSTYSK